MDKTGKIGSTALHVLTWPLSRLPLGFHRACGRFIGRLAGRVVSYRRDVVMTNLARCFPEMRYDELTATCNRFYAHLGKVFTEALWFGGCTDPQRLVRSRIVTLTNPEVVNRLHELGRSVIVLSSHCGNWELYGGIVSYPRPERLAYPENDICVVYRRQSSPVWDSFLSRNRIAPVVDKGHYDGMVESFSIMRYVLKHRGTQKMYIFLNDQPTLAVGLKMLTDTMEQQGTYTLLFASIIIAIFPVVLFFCLFNKTIMENTAIGGLKG